MKKIIFILVFSFFSSQIIAATPSKVQRKAAKKMPAQSLSKKEAMPIKAPIKKHKALKVDAKNYYDVPGTDEFTRPN